MSISPRIIYPCDHIIIDKERTYGYIEMKRGDIPGIPDKVMPNISVIRVDQIVDKNKEFEFSKNIDYRQDISLNTVEWVNLNNPASGEIYFLRALYIKTIVRKETSDTCDRCCGNGWYADIFPDTGNIFMYEGQKLLQDFIKVLFTEKNSTGYGSTIKDILAVNISNEVELGLEIATIMQDCEDQIKSSQRSNINNGLDVDASEKLSRIEIKDVVFVRDENSCYISINIVNSLEESTEFTFKI